MLSIIRALLCVPIREICLKIDMNSENDFILAVCWFDKEQWQLLAKVDPEGVDGSYEEWRKKASKTIAELRSRGQMVVKVQVNVSEFLEWCQERGLEPDSSARSRYASFLAQKRYGKENSDSIR